MQKRDHPRAAVIFHPKLRRDPGADLTRRARRDRADHATSSPVARRSEFKRCRRPQRISAFRPPSANAPCHRRIVCRPAKEPAPLARSSGHRRATRAHWRAEPTDASSTVARSAISAEERKRKPMTTNQIDALGFTRSVDSVLIEKYVRFCAMGLRRIGDGQEGGCDRFDGQRTRRTGELGCAAKNSAGSGRAGSGSFCWRRKAWRTRTSACASAHRPTRSASGGGASRSAVWRALDEPVQARRVKSAMTRLRRSSV